MKFYQRAALLAGTGLVLICGTAVAQVIPAPPPADMYGPGRLQGRVAERALRDFDLNKDGKITKAELGQALSRRFSQLAGGVPTLSESRFAQAHEAVAHQYTDALFRRIDWNGDGLLSLSEFRAPLRARFSRKDRDGMGSVSCGAGGRRQEKGEATQHRHHLRGRSNELCLEADLNRDGRVTRAEFDKVVAGKYAAAAISGKGMTAAEFNAVELVGFHEMEARRFKRLDRNHDGKLTEAEFAAPAYRLFARLDKNADGVIGNNELHRPRHGRHGAPHKGAT